VAIAFDASSPAVVSGIGTTLTTASFDPPDQSLLVATVMGSASGTMSNNGSALTWTSRVSGSSVQIFTAPLASGRTGMTATVTTGSSVSWGFKLDVLTGADLGTPTGATGTGSSTSNNIDINGYVSTIASSRGILPTSTDDEAAWSSVFDGMRVAKAANTATPGTTVTFNLDAFGTGAANWSFAAVEILPLAVTVPQMRLVQSVAAVHRSYRW
jgi:hypothetical protein